MILSFQIFSTSHNGDLSKGGKISGSMAIRCTLKDDGLTAAVVYGKWKSLKDYIHLEKGEFQDPEQDAGRAFYLVQGLLP